MKYQPEKYDAGYFEAKHRFAMKPGYHDEMTRIVGGLQPRPSDVLLDIGCSSGVGAAFVEAKTRARVMRLDRYPYGLNKMDGTAPLAAQGDGLALPFPATMFGGCWMMHVIGHVPDPGRVLAEVYRVLKPNGRLALITPNWWYTVAMKLPNLWNGYQPDRTVMKFFRYGELARLMEEAGFVNLFGYTFGELPPCPARSLFRSRLYMHGRKA